MFGFRRKEEEKEKLIEAFGSKWLVRDDVRLMIDEIASHLTEEELKVFEQKIGRLSPNFYIRMFDKCLGKKPACSLARDKWKIKMVVDDCRFLIHMDKKHEMFLDFVTFTLFEKAQ